MSSINLNHKELEILEEMAKTGFLIYEIADALEIEQDKMFREFKNKESIVYKRYRKGFLYSELLLRQRIFKDAKNGSSPAQALAKKMMDECAYKIMQDEE